MNKKDVKKILMSMKTPENEAKVNYYLGAIDLLSDEELETRIVQIGDNEESIRQYFECILAKEQNKKQEGNKHVYINKMISYGVTDNCIHLHMPVDLHEMIKEKGISATMGIVNLYLLDAIDKLRQLQNDGYKKLQDKNMIYMISPILFGRENRFLGQLGFETAGYTKKELNDVYFVNEHLEAQLAITHFGRKMNVGTAKIGMDVINSPEWQKNKKSVIKQLAEQGITLEGNDNQETLE